MMPLLGVVGAGGGPSAIPNLELWLDAADLAYLGNGAAVTTWPDKSGNARDFACTNTVVYTTTSQTPAGGPVVGGTNWVAQRAPWMASAAGEIFLVWKAINAANNRNLMRFTAQTGTDLNDHWRWSDNNVYTHFGTTVRKTAGTTVLSATGYGVWYTTDIYSAASDWAIYTNNPTTPRYSTTSNVVGWGSTNHAFGNYSGTASSHQIAEVCLFGRKLTTDERAAMFTYLAARHMPEYLFSDDFNRMTTANNIGAPQIGQPPTYHTGSWTTDGSKLNNSTLEGFISWDMLYDSYVADFTVGHSVMSNDSGFTVRLTDNMNCWLIYVYNQQTALYTRDGGSYNLRGQLTGVGGTPWAVGDVCRVTVTPAAVSVSRQPSGSSTFTSIGSVSSTLHATATRIGVRTNTSGTNFGADSIVVRPHFPWIS